VFASRAKTLRHQKMLGEGEVEFSASGRAPRVVAFHGFGGTATDLRPILDRVAEEGFAVDASLLPGHGTRVEALQTETFDRWVEAGRARERTAAAAEGSFVLVGFSLGSLVAMELASERPEGLAGLVVLGNALTLSWMSSVPMAVVRGLVGGRMPDAYMLKPLAADLVDRRRLGDVVTYDRHPLRAAAEVYLAGPRVRAHVSRIACPTLVLHGRRDRVCPWRNAEWLARHLGTRDVRVRIFERSAHVLGCDGEREEVAEEVTAFLRRLSPVQTRPVDP
jgi:carboxylesterase